MKSLRIIIIEDDLLARIALEQKLISLGHSVTVASSGEEAKIKVKNIKFDMAFVDLDLDRKLEGLTVIPKLKERNIHSVVLSGREEDSIILECYKKGADDYLAKPINPSALQMALRKLEQKDVNDSIKSLLTEKFHSTHASIEAQVETIANSLLSDRPILILGETGTGKTFLAKLIHSLSGEHLPFVQVNCSEFSESLLESELFGHEKGAFTGAIKNKKGFLELANNGILFLDEISTMSVSLQKKLLKAIEEKEFYPVGSEKKVKSNFRIISATCEDLLSKVESGEFRQDLYFRIEGFNISLLPLRERRQDIDTLVKYFVKKETRRFVFDDEAMKMMNEYAWPGNVRELEKVIEVLRSNSIGIVTPKELSSMLLSKRSNHQSGHNLDEIKEMGLNAYVEKLEMQILSTALKSNNEKVRKTLSDLKISNNSFYRIMDNIKSKGATNAY